MESITFFVHGSSNVPYCVEFFYRDNILSGSCTCGAGKNSSWCKHRVDILEGNIRPDEHGSSYDLETVLQWYNSSDIKEKINEIKALDKEIEKSKKESEKAKKQLSFLFNR